MCKYDPKMVVSWDVIGGPGVSRPSVTCVWEGDYPGGSNSGLGKPGRRVLALSDAESDRKAGKPFAVAVGSHNNVDSGGIGLVEVRAVRRQDHGVHVELVDHSIFLVDRDLDMTDLPSSKRFPRSSVLAGVLIVA